MPNLIDSHVNVKQTKLAINALLDHAAKVQAKREETELLGARDELVWLNVNVKRVHPEKKLKPFSIPLARPIIDPRTSPICLITKDPQREYKDLLAAQNIKFISRVVGVTKLKGKFKPFEARRQLLKDHGLFLADDRVVPLLPKLLGKMFFDAKKQPTPVNLQRKDLKAELERAVSSTYMHQNQGTCTSIKIAPISFTPGQVLENLTTALPHIVKHIKGGWDNVQSLNIKTSTSVSLPIWSCDLGSGEGGRWAGMTAPSEESATTSESEEEEEESVIKEGKKRAAPIAPARETNKKAKSDSAEVTKPTNATTAAPTKPKTTPVAATTKAVSIAAPPPAKKLAKNAIPQTPVVEESDSEGEPTPAPRSVSNAKKRAVVAGVDLKKAKILATKGSLRKGSKAKIFGSK